MSIPDARSRISLISCRSERPFTRARPFRRWMVFGSRPRTRSRARGPSGARLTALSPCGYLSTPWKVHGLGGHLKTGDLGDADRAEHTIPGQQLSPQREEGHPDGTSRPTEEPALDAGRLRPRRQPHGHAITEGGECASARSSFRTAFIPSTSPRPRVALARGPADHRGREPRGRLRDDIEFAADGSGHQHVQPPAANRTEGQSVIGGPRDLKGRAHVPKSSRDGGRGTSSIAATAGPSPPPGRP